MDCSAYPRIAQGLGFRAWGARFLVCAGWVDRVAPMFSIQPGDLRL